MEQICIDTFKLKILIYYMIMFPFPLTERVFPFMDTGLKGLQIFVFILCITELAIRKIPFITMSEMPMIVFMLWGLISTCIKSSDELFYYIHWTVFPILSMIAFSKCFYREGLEKAIRCVSKLYVAAIWINFVLMILFPTGIVSSNVGAVTYRANWLFGSKNNIVAELPYILMFLFYDLYLRKSKGKSVVMRYVTLVIMLLSFSSMGSEKVEFMGGSTTGIIAILIFIIMYGLSRFHYLGKIRGFLTVKLITVTSLILMVLVVAISQGEIKFIDNLLFLLGKDRTFSGRSYVWQEAILSIQEYPFLGIGCMQKIFHIYGYSNNLNTGLYSFWITILVRYGIVGVFLVIVMLFTIKFQADSEENGGFYIALAYFLMMVGGLSNPTPWKTIIFIVMSLIIYNQEKSVAYRLK